MSTVFDRLESRAPAARESALFRDLVHVLAVSKVRAPALRTQLRGIDVGALRGRADLAAIPLRRRDDLLAAQAEAPPFGGFAASRVVALAHLFAAPGLPLAPGGRARDWWGLARALHAAGLAKGDLLLNCCSYDLAPEGHMVEAGARAIGCPVLPAGNAPADLVAGIAARLAPSFACGTAGRLAAVLDAGRLRSPPERMLVLGALDPALREAWRRRGLAARQALVLPEVGLVAFESGAGEGLTLAEGLLLEVVDPVTGRPVAPGGEGEMVLSRVNLDYPLLRYATGLVTRVLPEPATCGRTNTRLAMPRLVEPQDLRRDGGRVREVFGGRLHGAGRRRGAIAAPASPRDEAATDGETLGA